MELITKIDARTRLSATLEEDGALSVTAFATAPYTQGASATAQVVTCEIPDDLRKELAHVMAKVLQRSHLLLGERLPRAVHQSVEIAARMGELKPTTPAPVVPPTPLTEGSPA